MFHNVNRTNLCEKNDFGARPALENKTERKTFCQIIGCFINSRLKLLKTQVLWCAITMLFSLHIDDFCKYDPTLKQRTGANFKYFLMRPKYVVHGIVDLWCLNLQTFSCTHQAQKLIFVNFELLKKQTLLCLLGAYYFVRQCMRISCQTYFGFIKKFLKLFSAVHLKVRLFFVKYATKKSDFCMIFFALEIQPK